jgi:Pentapeptide repeats (8 copies)
MTFICTACGTQYPPSEAPPGVCLICTDERQFVPASGQSWTTLEKLRYAHSNKFRRLATGLTTIETTPAFSIGQRAILARTDLAGARIAADLSGASLFGASLAGANLAADMKNQSMGLMRAVLRSANLEGAIFRGADLARVDLGFASLRGADLTGASLVGATLGGADLSGATLAQADLAGADFNSTKLIAPTGLGRKISTRLRTCSARCDNDTRLFLWPTFQERPQGRIARFLLGSRAGTAHRPITDCRVP